MAVGEKQVGSFQTWFLVWTLDDGAIQHTGRIYSFEGKYDEFSYRLVDLCPSAVQGEAVK